MRKLAQTRRLSTAVLSPMTNLATQKAAPSLRIVGGQGCRVFDDQGRGYL